LPPGSLQLTSSSTGAARNKVRAAFQIRFAARPSSPMAEDEDWTKRLSIAPKPNSAMELNSIQSSMVRFTGGLI